MSHLPPHPFNSEEVLPLPEHIERFIESADQSAIALLFAACFARAKCLNLKISLLGIGTTLVAFAKGLSDDEARALAIKTVGEHVGLGEEVVRGTLRAAARKVGTPEAFINDVLGPDDGPEPD